MWRMLLITKSTKIVKIVKCMFVSMSKIINYLKIFTFILIAWVFISSSFTLNSLILSFFISFIVFLLCYKMNIFSSELQIFTFGFLRYIHILMIDILHSSIAIIKIIFTDKIDIVPEIRVIDVGKLNKQEKILFANLITMTPGTFVIAITGDNFLIHSIDKSFFEQLLKDVKNNKITALLHSTRIKKAL